MLQTSIPKNLRIYDCLLQQETLTDVLNSFPTAKNSEKSSKLFFSYFRFLFAKKYAEAGTIPQAIFLTTSTDVTINNKQGLQNKNHISLLMHARGQKNYFAPIDYGYAQTTYVSQIYSVFTDALEYETCEEARTHLVISTHFNNYETDKVFTAVYILNGNNFIIDRLFTDGEGLSEEVFDFSGLDSEVTFSSVNGLDLTIPFAIDGKFNDVYPRYKDLLLLSPNFSIDAV